LAGDNSASRPHAGRILAVQFREPGHGRLTAILDGIGHYNVQKHSLRDWASNPVANPRCGRHGQSVGGVLGDYQHIAADLGLVLSRHKLLDRLDVT
jgi:hypothetical protein